VRVPYAGKIYEKEEMGYAMSALRRGYLTGEKYTKQFEEGLANYIGVKFAYFVNSGSSANLLAALSLIDPGDEVITVACGFPTTVAPIVQAGGIPVFIDVDDTCNINVAQLEEARTNKTTGIFAAHTLGVPFDINSVLEFCDKYRLWLIEDNCDALGSTYAGKRTGSYGHVATSSFYPAHHITTGEGGAVYTDHPELAKKILSLRDWGRDCSCQTGCDNTCGRRFNGQYGTLPKGYDHKYVYSRLGYNLKATDIQAAIGCAQLEKLDQFTKLRQDNWRYLKSKISLPTQEVRGTPSPFAFLMFHPERDKVVYQLELAGIQTRPLFAGNILRHPCMNHVNYRSYDLTNTDSVMTHGFMVGCWPGLSTEMLDHVIEKVNRFA
jgi:CDP-6-deoxy-D-xylo-4-hexulose-3-dehydrase